VEAEMPSPNIKCDEMHDAFWLNLSSDANFLLISFNSGKNFSPPHAGRWLNINLGMALDNSPRQETL
jgi:hypothetical protein